MTEDSYQQGRKVMQRANYLRGEITTKKDEVAKWTRIEASWIEKGEENRANGANKILKKALEQLEKSKQRFAELKFPESNIVIKKKQKVQCEAGCGSLVDEGEVFCKECLG